MSIVSQNDFLEVVKVSLFGDNLKRARVLAGLSRQDMADALSLTPLSYGKYEQGSREPKIDSLRLIASVLHVSVDDLIGNESADVPAVERLTSYLEKSIGFKVEREGEAVNVYFHNPETGAKNGADPARFKNEDEFVDVITGAMDKFTNEEERRRAKALYDTLYVWGMLSN